MSEEREYLFDRANKDIEIQDENEKVRKLVSVIQNIHEWERNAETAKTKLQDYINDKINIDELYDCATHSYTMTTN